MAILSAMTATIRIIDGGPQEKVVQAHQDSVAQDQYVQL